MEQSLMHYGTKRHSGRYPWGSGENPYQREGYGSAKSNRHFNSEEDGLEDTRDGRRLLKAASDMKAAGLSESERALALGYTRYDPKTKTEVGDTRKLRAAISVAKNEKIKEDIAEARKLKDKGWSDAAIAEKLGRSPSSIRDLLSPGKENRENLTLKTADDLKALVGTKDHKYIDVGKGVNYELGISEERLKNALAVLESQGYDIHTVKVMQQGTGKYTTLKVLCPPGTDYGELIKNQDKISSLKDYTVDADGIKKPSAPLPPVKVAASRIDINYAENGGKEKDGVIELRRGVDDISLGKAEYAQVRIAVDNDRYLKGMAIYSDDLPPGVDIRFNTNKHAGTPMEDVLKKMKDDKENPFGATIKDEDVLKMCQKYYTDPQTGEKKQSAINVVHEQGDWDEWSKSLSSQFLSKQPVQLVNRQLNEAIVQKKAELEEINSITNATVKKQLLESFADSCDSDSVHLKAAALPRQSSKVILPFNDLKENEVYAPGYRNGESVILIRHPHAGTFEIPELKVTNEKDTSAKKTLGNSQDAIGINHKVAEQLSGADFDGDSVIVIPVKKANGERIVNIKTSPAIKDLQEFDPKETYAMPKGVSNGMTDRTKGIEMGKISNLITDMTIKGAPIEDITLAVKHSMVVIDAQKHNLDYRQSEKDNQIARLKKEYQDGKGVSTIVSRAKHEVNDIPERKERYQIDPKTGERVWISTNREKKAKDPTTGKYVGTGELATQSSTMMTETRDARTLMSKHPEPVEVAYANYANTLKSMANAARKETLTIKEQEYSPTAAKMYAQEVKDLNEKLLVSLKNAPRERQAQLIARTNINTKKAADPVRYEDKDALKKLRNNELKYARAAVGANKKSVMIDITENEWKAIQAGAITKTKLKEILNNTDEKRIRELASPRQTNTLSTAQISRIRSMNASGKTLAQIADALGVSTSTVSRVVNG